METNTLIPSEPPIGGAGQGFFLFLSGLVLPLGSLTFYRKVAQQKVAFAILFFFLFTSGITLLMTINLAKGMVPVQAEIQKSFDEGRFPEITIRNGIAHVKGDQTVVMLDDPKMFVAIDTTGKYTGIDRSRYEQGFLLTGDTLVFLSQSGDYRSIPLSEINSAFNQDPIVVNAETTILYWQVITLIVLIGFFIGLIFWNTFVRLMYVAMLALLIWAVASLIRPSTGFGPVIITGLYALVPAIYLSYLFDLAHLSFPGLQTILLVPFWAAGLFASFSSAEFIQNQPLRLWRALIGLPLIVLLVVDIFVEYPYQAGIGWALAGLTLAALVAAGLLTRMNRPVAVVPEGPATPPPPAAPQP